MTLLSSNSMVQWENAVKIKQKKCLAPNITLITGQESHQDSKPISTQDLLGPSPYFSSSNHTLSDLSVDTNSWNPLGRVSHGNETSNSSAVQTGIT